MADYSGKHAAMLRKVEAAGDAITFATAGAGSYNGTTGEWEDTGTDAVAGQAVEVPGDPDEYRILELIGQQAVTLYFVPTVIGMVPRRGQAARWAGDTRTVREIYPIRPNGTAIAAKVILS